MGVKLGISPQWKSIVWAVFQHRVMRIFGPKRETVRGE